MNYTIAHELPGRIRFRCGRGAFSKEEARVVEYLLESQSGVLEVVASHITGSVLVRFSEDARAVVLSALTHIDRSYLDGESAPERHREPSIAYSTLSLFSRMFLNRFLPVVVRAASCIVRYVPYFLNGIRSLILKKLDVSVLDASAIGVSILFGDFGTAAAIMSLLAFGEILENWTRTRSKMDLAKGLALNESSFWVERDGTEVRIAASELVIGDDVIVRAGSIIPVDGTVVRGEAAVNQSVMTGEALPVHRYPGTTVYAGTVLEEGELLVRTTAFDNGTAISRIVRMIDESERMKAEVQSRAEKLADGIVPYSFLLAAAVFLVTGNFRKATSVLLVDYSCAIKLSTPLAILSAMKEGAKHGIVIKGGRILEKIAEADTVVFDKTGTLSVASPKVARVVPFGEAVRDEVLRTAACLEEHFPHSIARAVVRKAEEEDLSHREEHAEVEYAVAHGIASKLHGKRVIIGSDHFVLEDERIPISREESDLIDDLSRKYSLLYLAIGGKLAGVICIEDPLREEAHRVIEELREAGIGNIVMLTGDSQNTASHVASALGLEQFRARMLPEEKTEYIRKLHDRNAKVIMIGDGINDSPALSAADVGMAMKESADIAREISDVVLTRNNLDAIVTARHLATGTMRRIYNNYAFIIAINSLLLALGLGGVIMPSVSAMLHNASTIGASVKSLAPLLDEREGGRQRKRQRRRSADLSM